MPGNFGEQKITSVLYVYLPLGEKVKIFPVGISYLANYIHSLFPCINQHILDLAVIEKDKRWNIFKQTLHKFSPGIIAFSWRHIRYYGAGLHDEDLKPLIFYTRQSIKNLPGFLSKGFIRWENYFRAIKDNISFINWSCRNMTRSHILIGGAGFSIFYKDILQKLPEKVIGVIGEGEKTLAGLIRGGDFENQRVVRRKKRAVLKGRSKDYHCDLDVRNELRAVNYEYIETIFPGFSCYIGETIPVQTNRGCSQDCIYCPDTAKDRNSVVNREPMEVVKEIQQVKKVFQTNKIWFPDRLVVSSDTAGNFAEILSMIIKLNLHIKWNGYMRSDVFTKDLADLIVHSGLDSFIIAVTSGSQKIIDRLRLGMDISNILKGCGLLKEAGYQGAVEVEFALGIFEESPQDIKQSIDFYREIRNIFEGQEVKLLLNFCSVLPGSELEKTLLGNNYFKNNYNSMSLNPFMIKKFAYIHPSFRKIMETAYIYSSMSPAVNNRAKEEILLDFLCQA